MRLNPGLVASVVLLAACAAPRRHEAPPASVAASPLPVGPDGEWDRTLIGGSEDDDCGGYSLVRVVAGESGDPVSGALIENWYEADRPVDGAWSRESATVADSEGIAAVVRPFAEWWYVSAPGRGAAGFHRGDDAPELHASEDVTLLVLDPLGRPAAGVEVDYHLGCGHTPWIRKETTGPDGRLVLRGVDPRSGNLWIRGRGLAGRNPGYASPPADLPSADGVRILQAEGAPTVEGIVFGADGAPAAGVLVGTREAHRGPWTTTGGDGRFTLHGAPAFAELTAVAPTPPGEPECVTTFETLPGLRHEVHLRAAGEGGHDGATAATVPRASLRVTVESRSGFPFTGRTRIIAVRRDGRAFRMDEPEFEERGAVSTFVVDVGEWVVTAGTPCGPDRPRSVLAIVGPEGSDVAFALDSNPVFRPRLERADAPGVPVDPGEFRILIATPDGTEDAVPVSGSRDAFYVPAVGPFAMIVRDGTAGFDDRNDAEQRRAFSAPPTDDAPPFVFPRRREIHENPDEAAPGRAGTSRLTVLLPDGAPAAGALVEATASSAGGSARRDRESGIADERGVVDDVACEGDLVLVETEEEDLVPLEARLRGPGPWTLRWPASVVEIRAVDPAGASLEFLTVRCLDDRNRFGRGNDGVVRLRGVRGPYVRFLAGSSDFLPRDVRVRVVEEGVRRVTLRLEPRPAPASSGIIEDGR